WFGSGLATTSDRERMLSASRLASAGFAALALFALLRLANGYGNMRLFRDDLSLVQWLHVSKYPPSLTYTTLELGLMARCLALLVRLERVPAAASALAPLRVLGQTALFYYLLHVHFLVVAGWITGEAQQGGLGATYVATIVALVALFPLCVWYRGY